MMFVASFSMPAAAQHFYVKIENETTSIVPSNDTAAKEKTYKAGEILDTKVDATLYIHIIIAIADFKTHGVDDNTVFKIEINNKDKNQIKFYDDRGQDGGYRFGCFEDAEEVIKVGDNYIKYYDVRLLAADTVDARKDSIKQNITASCSYDSFKKSLDLTNCQYDYIIKNQTYKKDTQYEIQETTKITFLTTKEDVPNIILQAKDLKQGTWIKNWMWFVLLGVCVISLIIVIVKLMKRKKKRIIQDKKTPEKESSAQAQNLNNEPNEPKTDLDDILKSVQTLTDTVFKQGETLSLIKSLVSNTEDKKRLEQTTQELAAEKKKYKDAEVDLHTAKSKIDDLNNQIKQLEESHRIDGAVQLSDYSAFVSFAKKIFSECANAEHIAIKYWSSLTGNDQQIINLFISKFQMAKCKIGLSKWIGIIATLDLKGYVKNDEYTAYLKTLSNSESLDFLSKRFFEEILRPYVGAIILLLEQIRTATTIGVSVASSDNIAGLISSICTSCAAQDVKIDYKKLYECVTDFASLDIRDEKDLPNDIRSLTANVGENCLIYVDNYAVNLKSGETEEKTHCYIIQ